MINKLFSKLLVNKLSQILPKIISPFQSGFVKGRLMSDNILGAQELIHNIDFKSRNCNLVLKLDMTKAYDRVQWKFLFAILGKMGFPSQFIKLVKNSVQNSWFSVLVNGQNAGFFKSNRGLRQGDPLSPAFFIIVSEWLSRGLHHLVLHNSGMQYKGGGNMVISHLAFADDVMVFSKANETAMKKLMRFLSNYEKVSGQQINLAKSFFIAGKKVNQQKLQKLKETTGMKLQKFPVNYLGIKLHKGRKKKLFCLTKLWRK